LKLQGQDAQNHVVFTELKRIQQYFAKIKTAEETETEEVEAERRTTVNQEAAARVLKANLVRPSTFAQSERTTDFHYFTY
jgi:exosome complex protein LRP1